jgi:hypothetical protein
MFGMPRFRNFFLLGRQRYELIEVDGPIVRGGRACAVQFDHERRVLRVSRRIPPAQRALVVACAVSDACRRLWRPVPVVWPRWWQE